ncbi:MAG: TcfC E-set like domain-containing protein [Pseudomonadota bacterium]
MSRATRWLCAIGVAAGVALSTWHPLQAAVEFDTEAIPEGFADLAGPQEAFVDIWFGDEKRLATPAIYDLQSLTFVEPQAVLSALDDLATPDAVFEILSGPLPLNDDLACFAPNFPSGCGRLEPAVAGIIFNESQFRVDVFVNPELLVVRAAPVLTRLPRPPRRETGIASVSGAFGRSRSSGESYNAGVFGKGTFGDGYLDYSIGVSDEHPQPRIETGSYNWETGEHHVEVGLFRSRSFGLVNSIDVIGGRIASSLNTRLDLEQIAGSPIALFLQRRSVVQIRRDGRLLSSKAYPAGNQLIDSQTLPAGAYEIELTIIDPVSGERRENRFFVKSNELPPVGEDIYHVEFGCTWQSETNTQFLPNCDRPAMATASYSRRMTGHTALAANLAASGHRVLLGAGGNLMLPHLKVRGTAHLGTRGERGLQIQASTTIGRLTAAVNASRLWDDAAARRPTTLLSEPFRALDVTLNYSWRRLQLSARYSFSHLLLSNRRVQLFSPSARMNLGRFRGFNVSWSTEATHTDGSTQVLMSLLWLRNRKDWDIAANTGVSGERPPRDVGPDVLVQSTWRDNDRWRDDVTVTAKAGKNRSTTTAGLDAEYTGRWGEFGALGTWGRSASGETEVTHGGSFSFGAAYDDQRRWHLGDTEQGSAAVVVELDGAPVGETFDVVINRAIVGEVAIGSERLFSLAPYRQHSIELRAKDDKIMEYDQQARVVTLFPGHVSRQVWRVAPAYVLIASVVDFDGQIIESARIEGGMNPAIVDDGGVFQLEVIPGSALIFTLPDGAQCVSVAPEPETDDFVQVLDTPLTCFSDVAQLDNDP